MCKDNITYNKIRTKYNIFQLSLVNTRRSLVSDFEERDLRRSNLGKCNITFFSVSRELGTLVLPFFLLFRYDLPPQLARMSYWVTSVFSIYKVTKSG